MEKDCFSHVQDILAESRKQSMRKICSSKWKRFSIWATQHHLVLDQAWILKILDCLNAVETFWTLFQLDEGSSNGDISILTSNIVAFDLLLSDNIEIPLGPK